MQIIFGTKGLTERATRNVSTEKYEDKAVVTVEGVKGHKKARRILFNTKCCEALGLEVGTVQELVFAPVQDTKQVLIANMATIVESAKGDMISYKTSKNKVSYGGESAEKGKAATTSFMCKELFSFFGKDESQDLEFELNEFPSESVEAFSLDLIEELHPLTNNVILPTNATEENNIELSLEKMASNEMDHGVVKGLELAEDLSSEQGPNIVHYVAQDVEGENNSEELPSLNRVVVTE